MFDIADPFYSPLCASCKVSLIIWPLIGKFRCDWWECSGCLRLSYNNCLLCWDCPYCLQECGLLYLRDYSNDYWGNDELNYMLGLFMLALWDVGLFVHESGKSDAAPDQLRFGMHTYHIFTIRLWWWSIWAYDVISEPIIFNYIGLWG
jgi:hypothetical protein